MPKRPLEAFGDSDSDDEPPPAPKPKRPVVPEDTASRDEELEDYMTLSVALDKETETDHSGLRYNEIQTVTREEAMEKSLFDSLKPSIGLSMMQKMGFKVGQSLGKNLQNAPTAPLKVSLKNNKTGLGAKRPLDALQPAPNGDFEFRDRLSKEKTDLDALRLIQKLQKVCFLLSGDEDKFLDDALNGAEINILWKGYVKQLLETNKLKEKKRVRLFESNENPRHERLTLEEDAGLAEHEARPISERLDTLMLFARDKFFYCAFCGCAYTDQKELEVHCPGLLEDDHL